VWRALRDELVHRHLPLVHFLARRFRDRGEALPDLVQVATIGLIKAVDRYDPARGVEFTTFATPTIAGEIKRHFRDRAWAVRVPRRLQEQKAVVSRATTDLFQTLGRSPTVTELAAHTALSEEQVLESLETVHAYATVSLDAETDGESQATGSWLGETLGELDAALEKVEYRESLRPMLEKLGEREKQILLLRFFSGMTQSDIASEVGISQMHVSRLLARTLARLREGLLADE
jgi:RNA polymerase sigma-B factor